MDLDSAQYKFCCGQIGHRLGCSIICTTNTVILCLLVIADAVNRMPIFQLPFSSALSYLIVAYLFISIIMGLPMLIFGIRMDGVKLIFVYIILQCSWFVLITLCLITQMATSTTRVSTGETGEKIADKASLAVGVLSVVDLLQVFTFSVLVSFYKYLKLKHRENNPPGINAQPPVYNLAGMYPTLSESRLNALNDLPSYESACKLLGISNPQCNKSVVEV